MNISKNSWHYRFLKTTTVTSEMPRTLCSYFWTLVGKLLLVTCALGGTAVLIISYPILAWSAFVNHSKTALVPFLAISMFVCIFSIPVLYVLLSKKIELSDNLVIQMFRATKNKFCPFITYTEDDQ